MQGLAPQIADTVRDTAVVKTPLPGGVGVFVRWMFNLPTAVQIAAALVGAAIAAWILLYLWSKRAAIIGWLTTRSRGVKLALAGVVAVVVVLFAAFGLVSWNYMMHNNDFCVSCHVMTPAFSRFQHSEHKQLKCHDCHQQSLFASMRQLVLWVAEKPDKIPPHAKVPNQVCGNCHIQKKGADSVWKRIVATVGHRVHLNSDSSVLKNVQCVKCHGLEVHHFVPVDSTCGQVNCHQNVHIRIAKMQDQTSLHCVGCHQFTRRVSETISLDSTRKELVPTFDECLGCHEMKEKLGKYDVAVDPHQGVCGACHDPHKQTKPAEAWQTCERSGCHQNPASLTSFHRGITPTELAKCETCHQPHTWAVSGDKCLTCHKTIYEDRPPGSRTAAGLTPARTVSNTMQGTGYTGDQPFSHRRHRDEPCTTCHATGKVHGALLVHTVQDCRGCHHANAASGPSGATAGKPARLCTSCHNAVGLPQQIQDTVTFKLTVWKEPKKRAVGFRHDKHAYADCTLCHATPVSLAVPPEKSCQSCHDKHHQPDVQCRACHPAARNVHIRDAHLGCTGSQCHAPQTVQGLQPKRNVCLVCHQTQVNHKPGKECAACHQVEWLSAQKGTE